MTEKLEVWLDVDFLDAPCRVGRLSHDKGQVWFSYEKSWLENPFCFSLDPDLTLDAAPFFPKPEMGNFGIFLDSSPDRWGQMLMKRRELLEAKDAKRPPKNLYAWDYLIRVQDETRQGALRFKREGEDTFLALDPLPAPPITSLRELQAVALEVSNKKIDDLSALRKWLSVLVSPGSSLGGARPKANFRDVDGSLWIAKFPARDDMLDVGAWEGVAHSLSRAAGINVQDAKLLRFGSNYHTFCVKRFDRNGSQRVFYSSAMTLLKKEQSEGASYLDIAQFLHTQGAEGMVKQGLEQLFRRVVFNVAIGNRDDHLRNHGFLLRPQGWILAPAFDVNPNPDKREHVLNIDESDNRPDLAIVSQTAEWYELSPSKAMQIIEEVVQIVQKWQEVARRTGISGAEIELMRHVFSGEAA
jgi:serine/threonine-protein kinase HipA